MIFEGTRGQREPDAVRTMPLDLRVPIFQDHAGPHTIRTKRLVRAERPGTSAGSAASGPVPLSRPGTSAGASAPPPSRSSRTRTADSFRPSRQHTALSGASVEAKHGGIARGSSVQIWHDRRGARAPQEIRHSVKIWEVVLA